MIKSIIKKSSLALLLSSTLLSATNIELSDAYIRATPPGIPNSASFLTIKNNSNEDVFLTKVTSDIAKNVELHQHTMQNNMMKMSQVQKIKISKHSKTTLQPGGYHVMLLNLKSRPLKIDEKYTFTYIFSNNEKITKVLSVKSVMAGMKHKKMMDHGKMMKNDKMMDHSKMMKDNKMMKHDKMK